MILMGKMQKSPFFAALLVTSTLAFSMPALAEAARFFPLNQGQARSYISSGNKFLPLRGMNAATSTVRPRVVRPTAPMAAEQQTSGFVVRRYEPPQRAMYRLRNQTPAIAAPTERLGVAPIPRDNHGNKELTSNAPYSASFYGASNIGLTEHTWPVDLRAYKRISSGFGMREHPVTGQTAFHKGVDFAAPTGTAVLASADGVVEETGQDMLIGKFVRLRHPDGSQSLYGHLSTVSVQETAWLNRYDKLGEVGTTGRTTGPHLHYALNVDGKPMNPMQYLTKPSQLVASK